MLSVLLLSLIFPLTSSINFPPPINPFTLASSDAPIAKPAPNAKPIPNSYIVHLFNNYTLSRHFKYCRINFSEASPEFTYIPALHSYAAQIDNGTLHQRVLTDPGVRLVEHDYYVEVSTLTSRMNRRTSNGSLYSTKPWYSEFVPYAYWPVQMVTATKKLLGLGEPGPVRRLVNAGEGVDAYVIDWGIRITHDAFQGRASNFRNHTRTPYCRGGGNMDDETGHGTAVASVLAGAKFSSSQASIINVKIGCNGNPAEYRYLAEAIVDVVNDHIAKAASSQNGFGGSIINLSLGGPFSELIANAIAYANTAGLVVVAGAGNSFDDAPFVANYIFPCNHRAVVCVSSCDQRYEYSSWASHGTAVDIFAPGNEVPIASNNSDNAMGVQMGTSLSSGVVSGVLSHFMGHKKLRNDPSAVKSRMRANALNEVIQFLPPDGTPNRLINTGYGSVDGIIEIVCAVEFFGGSQPHLYEPHLPWRAP